MDCFGNEVILEQDDKNFYISQPCFAYRGNCCQYQIRPLDCKTYQCALLKKLLSGKVTIEYALNIVNLTLTALDKVTAQYNADNAQSLTRDKISLVMKNAQQEARAVDLQKIFWRSNPDYLTFCFLRKKHFIK